METRANYVVVGTSVLAAFAALIIFIFWLGRTEFGRQADVYYTYFSGSVAGLSTGSPVRYRGVPVGSVGNVEINPDNVEQIRVTLKLNPGTPVKVDSIASLASAGITGGSYIELVGGTRGSALLKTDNGPIPVIQSENSGLQSLIADLPKVLGKLSDLLDSANGALSTTNIKGLSDTITHLQNFTANLDALSPDLKSTITNINGLASDLHTQVPKLVDSVKDDGVSVRAAADSFHQVANNLDGLIAENRGPLRDFTGNGLSELSGLITQLRGLTDTLTRVADHLDRDPQRYLFGGGTTVGVDPNQPIGAAAGGASR
jgi:phospholipid/cholesterol/gamma-HCH transport system substrate-binding protein